jgi:hypothetical protein
MPTDVIEHSVTKDDYQIGVFNYFGFGYQPLFKILPPAPPYWSITRDQVLRQTLFVESNWSSAVGIALSKMASQSWSIKSNIALKAKRAREMFLSSGGPGWTGFVKRAGRNYLLSDNGMFVEIVRQTSAAGSKILGFVHLDSARCTRTNDPDNPVLYRDRKGGEHLLKWYQVFSLADMADPGDTYNGVGYCAASRAYNVIRRLATMEQFMFEKVSGARPLSLHFITGTTDKQIRDAITEGDEERKKRGGVAYGGAILIPFMQKEGIGHVEVPMASLPPNFDRKQELDSALLVYADALGLDIQDLMPLSGGPLGTSMQSQVLHDKSSGKGLAVWRQEIAHLFNDYVLDERTTFYFNERDYRDEMQKAQVNSAVTTNVVGLVAGGIISNTEGRQIAADEGVIPREMLANDLTTTETVTDSDKPFEPPDPNGLLTNPPQAPTVGAAPGVAAVPVPAAPTGVPVTKEVSDIMKLIGAFISYSDEIKDRTGQRPGGIPLEELAKRI